MSKISGVANVIIITDGLTSINYPPSATFIANDTAWNQYKTVAGSVVRSAKPQQDLSGQSYENGDTIDQVPPSASNAERSKSLNSVATHPNKVIQIDLSGHLQNENGQVTPTIPLSLNYQSSFAGTSPMRSGNRERDNEATMGDDSDSQNNTAFRVKTLMPQTIITPPRSNVRPHSPTYGDAAGTMSNVIPPPKSISPNRTIITPMKPPPIVSRTATPVRSSSTPSRSETPSRPTVPKCVTPAASVTPSRAPTPSSSSAVRTKKYANMKFDPVEFPVARVANESITNYVPKYDVSEYLNTVTTEDKGDGSGFGRRISSPVAFDPDYFLGDREGVVNSLKRFRREERRIREEEKSVGSLIEKFRDISASDYNHQIINHFGFEKIYSIYDFVKQVYHPYPSPNSPFLNKIPEPIIEEEEGSDDDKSHDRVEKCYAAERDFLNVSVSGLKREHENTERDHAAPHSSRQSSVKQIAREKRFCHELFLPLLNAKLQPEMIDFIKEEVTMQLNIKICDLYDDPELLISDKETFEKALGAYLRSEKLIKQLQEARDGLVAFVKENMPN